MGKTKQKRNLNIGVYSPYWKMSGGGERYLYTIASILSENNDVRIFGNDNIRETARQKFDLNLSHVQLYPENAFLNSGIVGKIRKSSTFDLFFYMTDGSLFMSRARKNFLVVQSPIHLPAKNLLNMLKLHNWTIICYSDFMQKHIEKKYNKKSEILSPGIDIQKFSANSSDKKNIILTVGRFFRYPHHKHQDFLAEAFKNGYKKYFRGWKLIIAGGITETGGKQLLDNLRQRIQGYPIEIKTDLSSGDLIALYKCARIYWHAAGVSEDTAKYPEKAEHFGITTLEAMAAGNVPVVFQAGGQEDIVKEGINGYFWKTEKELLIKTSRIINDKELYYKLSKQVVERASDFSLSKFHENLSKLIG